MSSYGRRYARGWAKLAARERGLGLRNLVSADRRTATRARTTFFIKEDGGLAGATPRTWSGGSLQDHENGSTTGGRPPPPWEAVKQPSHEQPVGGGAVNDHSEPAIPGTPTPYQGWWGCGNHDLFPEELSGGAPAVAIGTSAGRRDRLRGRRAIGVLRMMWPRRPRHRPGLTWAEAQPGGSSGGVGDDQRK